jgi:hypothetical protein
MLASAVGATPSDFQFTQVELISAIETTAILGHFNVLVAPELQRLKMDYARQGVEPIEALGELARAAGATVTEIKDAASPLWVVTKAALPAGIATPVSAGGTPTDFSFKDVQMPSIVKTMAVLGRFGVACGPGVEAIRLSVNLKQVECTQALFWVATICGLDIQRSDASAQPLYTLTARKP